MFTYKANSGQDLLPGFEEAIKRMEDKGFGSSWVLKNVDLNDSSVCFDNGKKFSSYKSDCPFYVGYHWSGGISSVECKCNEELIPGLQHSLFCHQNHTDCIFYKDRSDGKYFFREETPDGKFQVICILMMSYKKLEHYPEFLRPYAGNRKDGYKSCFYLLITDGLGEIPAGAVANELEGRYASVIEEAKETGNWEWFPFTDKEIIYTK